MSLGKGRLSIDVYDDVEFFDGAGSDSFDKNYPNSGKKSLLPATSLSLGNTVWAGETKYYNNTTEEADISNNDEYSDVKNDTSESPTSQSLQNQVRAEDIEDISSRITNNDNGNDINCDKHIVDADTQPAEPQNIVEEVVEVDPQAFPPNLESNDSIEVIPTSSEDPQSQYYVKIPLTNGEVVVVPIQNPSEYRDILLTLILQNPSNFDLIKVDGFLINASDWKTVCGLCQKEKFIKAAQILFMNLFSNPEILSCTKSGRGDAEVLDPTKTLAIINALNWIYYKIANGEKCENPSKIGYEFGSNCENVHQKLPPTKIQEFFTDYRNQASRRLQEESKLEAILNDLKSKPEAILNNLLSKNFDKYWNLLGVPSVWKFGEFEIPRQLLSHLKMKAIITESKKPIIEALLPILIRHLFSIDELKYCTLNGKGTFGKLCTRKQTCARGIIKCFMKHPEKYVYNLAGYYEIDGISENWTTEENKEVSTIYINCRNAILQTEKKNNKRAAASHVVTDSAQTGPSTNKKQKLDDAIKICNELDILPDAICTIYNRQCVQ